MPKHPNGQIGRRYITKKQLIRQFADELIEKGELPTHRAIREMLDRERPEHKTHPTEIWLGLGRISEDKGPLPQRLRRIKERIRDGARIEVDGKQFPSIRSAARAHSISAEAARKRLASKTFENWKRLP